MGTAKVVTLSARPWKTTKLVFEAGGVLGQLDVQLGATVKPFDFATFYANLGATAAGDASLLAFDAQSIVGAPPVTASTLAALRAEPRKAALDRAIVLRQNAYYSKYANASAIVTKTNSLYGTAASAKPARLQKLSTLAQQQADELSQAYTTDGRTGVIKTTRSKLSSTTTTTDSSSSTDKSTTRAAGSGHTTATGRTNEEMIGGQDFDGAHFHDQPPPAGGGAIGVTINGPAQESFEEGSTGETSNESNSSTGSQSGTQTSKGKAKAVESQTIVNTDYGYRVPSVESQAQNERAQISLIDEQFAQFMAGQNLPNLATVLKNELSAIDRGVYQLQVGFLNTLLMSPIAGTVTGIYKMPGDFVRAGEPVVRIEDNSTIFLLATLVYRGTIRIGSTVSATTELFDTQGAPTTVSGSVVAVRGRGEDDEWELVVQCNNPLDGSGNPTFPIGYHFDYDNTTVTVT